MRNKFILFLLDLIGVTLSVAFFYIFDTQLLSIIAFFAYISALGLLSLKGFYSLGLRLFNHISFGPTVGYFILTSIFIGLPFVTLKNVFVIFCVNISLFLITRIVIILFSDLSKTYIKDLTKVYIYGLTSHSLVHYELISRSGVYWTPAIISDKGNSLPFFGRTISEAKFLSIAKRSKSKIEVHVAQEFYEDFCKLLPSLPANLKYFKILEASHHIGQLAKVKPVKFDDLDIQKFLNHSGSQETPILLNDFLCNKVILVTGGAGSIGSEIVRQLLSYDVTKIIVIDSSEFALYDLSKEIAFDSRVCLKLCSATDYALIESVFASNNIDIIFHAAAYKHVPLVEEFKLSGLRNNILATNNICKLAIKFDVQNFCLISTDKAVRPTNVMGASKRICEMVVSYYSSQKSNVIFSAVRFGNVLGSSGSVVPLFLSQINAGGPVTLTHREITRYFMSIPEAVSLVLVSTKMAKTGELFLLDMGEPVKIYDLAVSLIHACGFKVSSSNKISEDAEDGSIKIIESGLRPGEKLYEELLVSGSSVATDHPRIFKTFENIDTCIDLEQLLIDLDCIGLYSHDEDINKFLLTYVTGYKNG